MPYGERHPVKPVASWSRLVLPRSIAPWDMRVSYEGADLEGMCASGGHAVVVGRPAISILSLTLKGTPYSGGKELGFDHLL